MLAAVVMFDAAAVHAEETSKPVALVRAMRTDEISMAIMKLAFLKGEMVAGLGKTKDSCVRRVPYTDFTADWGRVVETVLSPEEIDQSLAFFKSDAGVKFVEGLVRRLRARQGKDSVLPEVRGAEALSEAQIAAISTFIGSDLGQKVTGNELTLSPAATELGTEMSKKIARMCAE